VSAKSTKPAPGKAKGSWTKARANAFRLLPNRFKSGELATLKIEGLAKPDEIAGQPVTVRILEVPQATELAAFEVQIAKAGKGFVFSRAQRTDEPPELPQPERPKTRDGMSHRFEIHWWRPHFRLRLDGQSEEHVVLLPVGEKRAEGLVYELGFEVKAGGKVRARSVNHPTLVLCGEVLAHNCRQAAKLRIEGQLDMLSQRGYGTCFGTGSDYAKAYHQTGQSHDRAVAAVELWRERRMAAKARARAANRELTQKENDQIWKQAVAEAKQTAPAGFPDPLEANDCVTYVYNLLVQAHAESLATADWKIADEIFLADPNRHGVSLARGLAAAGWEILYYNPDTRNPGDLDYDEAFYLCTTAGCKAKYSFDYKDPKRKVYEELGQDWKCGGCGAGKSAIKLYGMHIEHAESAEEVKSQGTYHGIEVDHVLFDYRPTWAHKCNPKKCPRKKAGRCEPDDHRTSDGRCGRRYYSGSRTPRAPRATFELLERVKRAPFALLLGRPNVHVATLVEGKVWESGVGLSPFNRLFKTEAPFYWTSREEDGWDYLSGVMALPPGTLDSKLPPVPVSTAPPTTRVYGLLARGRSIDEEFPFDDFRYTPRACFGGATVHLSKGSTKHTLETDDMGSFFVSLEPGSWHAKVELDPAKIPTVPLRFSEPWGFSNDFPGGPALQLAVMVRDAFLPDGQTVSRQAKNVKIRIVEDPSRKLVKEYVSVDGIVKFPALKAGDYVIHFEFEGKAFHRRAGSKLDVGTRPTLVHLCFRPPHMQTTDYFPAFSSDDEPNEGAEDRPEEGPEAEAPEP
jgi:hypothetical protein